MPAAYPVGVSRRPSLVETDAYAIEVCAYIVLNPVRAGLVGEAADWPWSSYRASADLVTAPPFLEIRLVPAMLHPETERAQALYRDLVRERAERPKARSG